MRTFKAPGRLGVAVCITAGVACILANVALASGGTKVCVPSRQGRSILTPKNGACRKGYTLTELGAEGKEGKEGKPGPEGKNEFTAEEIALLKSVLPHIKYVAAGVDGKPTVQFSGVNVQVVSGASGKKETEINGEGNLIVGYDETGPGAEQTGSNNFIVGGFQEYTSIGSILGGAENRTQGPYSDAVGQHNLAEGLASSVSGGTNNTAAGSRSSVSGGDENAAGGEFSSVSGGQGNLAEAEYSAVGGGHNLVAEEEWGFMP